MKSRTAKETAIICAAAVVAIAARTLTTDSEQEAELQ